MTAARSLPEELAYIECDVPPGVTLDAWRRRPDRPRAYRPRRLLCSLLPSLRPKAAR